MKAKRSKEYPRQKAISLLLDNGEPAAATVLFQAIDFLDMNGKQGFGMTLCQICVHGKQRHHSFFGMARCNPNDMYYAPAGQRIALKRAIHQLYKQVLLNAAFDNFDGECISEKQIYDYFRKCIYNALCQDGVIVPGNDQATPNFMRVSE